MYATENKIKTGYTFQMKKLDQQPGKKSRAQLLIYFCTLFCDNTKYHFIIKLTNHYCLHKCGSSRRLLWRDWLSSLP